GHLPLARTPTPASSRAKRRRKHIATTSQVPALQMKTKTCCGILELLWHVLPVTVVTRSPCNGCGTVSRPCHYPDRRSPEPAGDLRSNKWHGRETMPQHDSAGRETMPQ